MSSVKNFKNQNSTEDSFLYTKTEKNNVPKSHNPKLQCLPVEFPPPMDHLVKFKPSIPNEENDRTFWDEKIEEKFTFPGMTSGWKFKKIFNLDSLLYGSDKHDVNNNDVKFVLNYIAANENTNLGIYLLEDKDLINVKTSADIEGWAAKNPESSRKLLAEAIPLASNHVYNLEYMGYVKLNLSYLVKLNENFKELWHQWAHRQDEVQVLINDLSGKDETIRLLDQDIEVAIQVAELSESLRQRTNCEVEGDNIGSLGHEKKEKCSAPPRALTQLEQKLTSVKYTGNNYLDILKMRCENMGFLQYIESLQPPSKFAVVFAQSRIDGSPASLIRQLTLSGQEFPSLYELLKFMYQKYGIKDLYSYYERNFNAMKWPSGLDQYQNLAIFRAQIAPCKDILRWTNRATISRFLTKLPLWTQRDLATLRRNYTSRQLLAESRKSLLNENKVPIIDKSNNNKLSPDTSSPELKSNYPT
ncbi:hypothetical protein GcC1_191031, partial [Golovinomyces cichoracearum]